MSKVYIVNMVRNDISAARQWGEFKFINEKYVYPDELSEDGELPQAVRDALRDAALNFNPKFDYVLLVGDDLQRAAFMSFLGCLYREIRVLRWDRKAEGYIPAMIVGI